MIGNTNNIYQDGTNFVSTNRSVSGNSKLIFLCITIIAFLKKRGSLKSQTEEESTKIFDIDSPTLNKRLKIRNINLKQNKNSNKDEERYPYSFKIIS